MSSVWKKRKWFLCLAYKTFCFFGNVYIYFLILNGSYDFSTFRQNCPFFIRFRASDDGNHLEVVELQTDHNHDVSKGH